MMHDIIERAVKQSDDSVSFVTFYLLAEGKM